MEGRAARGGEAGRRSRAEQGGPLRAGCLAEAPPVLQDRAKDRAPHPGVHGVAARCLIEAIFDDRLHRQQPWQTHPQSTEPQPRPPRFKAQPPPVRHRAPQLKLDAPAFAQQVSECSWRVTYEQYVDK
ncbi:hypothetical protein GCM10009692_06740 [Leucobacter aridicollis]